MVYLTSTPTRFNGVYDLRRLSWRRREWELLGTVTFDTARLGGGDGSLLRIVVPVGSRTDFASIPRFLHACFPPDGPWGPAAIVHDYLYREGRCGPDEDARCATRRDADAVFLEGMDDLGVPWYQRWPMWLAVRLFGWWGYRPTR